MLRPRTASSLTLTFALLSAAALSGCGSNSDNTDAGATADTGGAATDAPSAGDAATGAVTVGGTFADDSTPLAGATIEVVGASPVNSTTTTAKGAWSLRVPAGQALFFRATKTGYRTAQVGITVPPAGLTDLTIQAVASDLPTQVFTATHLTENTADGIVVASFFTTSSTALPAGFGVTLSASGGTHVVIGHDGPPAVGNATMGDPQMMLIVNVTPGTTTVTPTTPTGFTCALADTGLAAVRVDPQVLTFVNFTCH